MSTTTGYSPLQIALHWVVGVLILYQLLMGEDMKPLWDELQRNGSYTMTLGGLLHILFGVLVLALVLWRLALRLMRGVPDAPDATPAMEMASKIGHLAIYALMIGLPVTGLGGSIPFCLGGKGRLLIKFGRFPFHKAQRALGAVPHREPCLVLQVVGSMR